MSGVYWLRDAKVGDEVMFCEDSWHSSPSVSARIERVTDTQVSVNGGKFSKNGDAYGSPYCRRIYPMPGTDAAKAVNHELLVRLAGNRLYKCSDAALEAIIALVEADLATKENEP